tara:strand:+ start:104 stop:553 length:450 start_codon:yes stop_codon:yes gene_type:complete
MPTIKVNKGGCKVGKKADKGGCKEGLKAPPVTGRLATKKTKVQRPPQQAKVVAAKPRVAKVAKVMPAKKIKLPNFEIFFQSKGKSGAPPPENTRIQWKHVYDRELLLRDAEGDWEGGASKKEMNAFRKKNPETRVAGIDYIPKTEKKVV